MIKKAAALLPFLYEKTIILMVVLTNTKTGRSNIVGR